MAIGVLEAASKQGLSVPEDISVMGYDDQELARYTHPPLSTLVLPNYEMGQRAVEALLDMTIHGKSANPVTIKINGPVVQRASTAQYQPLTTTPKDSKQELGSGEHSWTVQLRK